MPEPRKTPGMRERSPGVWELIVEAGRDPVTGRSRQISRTFHGTLRDAKKARAKLLVDVALGERPVEHPATTLDGDGLAGHDVGWVALSSLLGSAQP